MDSGMQWGWTAQGQLDGKGWHIGDMKTMDDKDGASVTAMLKRPTPQRPMWHQDINCMSSIKLNNNFILCYFSITSAPSTPAITLNHAIGGPNHDDSIHVDVLTTTPTPQTASTTCCGPRVFMVCNLLVYVGETMSDSWKSFNKNVKHVTPTTVKMVQVDNTASVSNQGCRISNGLETHGLNNEALCWVDLI